MTAQQQPYILYLGRPSATAETMRGVLGMSSGGMAAAGAPAMELVTSQKLALRAVHARPPLLLFVETTGKPDSRLRFCQQVRLRLPSVPIVAVGARTAAGYTYPFDAVVATPVEPHAAQATLRRILALPSDQTVQRGAIILNTATRRVSSPHGEYALTPKLAMLLQLLMERSGRLVRRADIMHQVWDTSYLEDTRTLDVHVRWLRKMIEPDPTSPIYLHTRRGEGYLFTVPDEQ